ncbi:MAG: glycerophosphodiester phosphodiesterase [Dehalococcoidia bacterium]
MTSPASGPLRPFLQSPRPLAFAHRGGARLWPENTMTAFQGAVDLGYRYLETDVHATRDGVLVTIHDGTLERTTDGSGPVSAITLEELKRLDAGYRFSPDGGRTFPFRGKGITVATLAEVAEAFPDVRLNVEVKQSEPPLVDAVAAAVALIEERALHDRILVASFDDRVIQEFRRRMGDHVATSSATWEATRFWLASRVGLTRWLRRPYDALQVPPRQGRLTVVDGRFVRAAHRRGLQVHVWTVDEAEEMRRLLDLGVDGLMSDRPDLLLKVLR